MRKKMNHLNRLDGPLLKARGGHPIHLDESKRKWHMVVVKYGP
jgi:hypothetical protein